MGQGHLHRPRHPVRPGRGRVPGALPRALLPHQPAGRRGDEGADARPPSRWPSAARSSTCSSASPSGSRPPNDEARSPTRPWSRRSCSSPRSPTTCSRCCSTCIATVINEIPLISDTGYNPITENPAKWVERAAPGLDGPGHLRVARVHPVHPRLDGRDAQRGLHPHRQGQGPAQAHGGLQARAARGHGPGRHHLRPRPRRPAGRHDLHRADLRHPRHRLVGRRGGAASRTSPSCRRPPCSVR